MIQSTKSTSLINGVIIIAGSCSMLFLLLWHAAQFYPFFSDDALISLQYAKRLLEGQGLTWTDGAPVEGYSNLLWILLLSLPGLFGVDLIIAARILGIMFLAIIPGLILFYSRHESSPILLVLSCLLLFLPLNATVAVWAIGGLEMPLIALLLCATALSLKSTICRKEIHPKDIALPALALGLLSLSRPDGFLFAATFFLSILLLHASGSSRRTVSKFLPVLLVPLCFVILQLIFRISYYGDWLPNSAYVKLSLTTERWQEGWSYLMEGLSAQRHFWVLIAIMIPVSFLRRSTRRTALFYAVPMAAWLVYIVSIGKDYLPAYRFLLPAFVLSLLLLTDVISDMMRGISRRRQWVLGIIGILFISTVMFPRFFHRQHASFNVIRSKQETWEWDGKVLGELLKNAFHEKRPLVSVTAAGCLPYWSELPSIDMFGLNDRHIAHNRPEGFGTGALGHELGDASYLLNRRPDMIILNIGVRLIDYPEYSDTMKTASFEDMYIAVTLSPDSTWQQEFIVWMRRESERVGIQRDAMSLTIPGYFLSFPENSVDANLRDSLIQPAAFQNTEKNIVMPIYPGQPLLYNRRIPGLTAAEVTVHGAHAECIRIHTKGDTLRLEAHNCNAEIEYISVEWKDTP